MARPALTPASLAALRGWDSNPEGPEGPLGVVMLVLNVRMIESYD